MVGTGLLGLNDPAAQYLPGIEFNNPWRDTTPVTVRHLLDHTSGLEDARLWQMFSERPEPDTPLAQAYPNPDKLLRIRTRPGSRFSYSNMGYGLLGMMIESITGRRYETWLDKNLLAPLDMNNSTFAFTTQQGVDADPLLAWGHIDDGSRYPATPIFLRPAGQFTTTSGDLGTLSIFLMGDGGLGETPFINGQLMQARAKPAGTLAADAGLIAGYSLGLGRRDRHGVISYCHSGNIVGFAAMLCIYPAQGKAFAYSVNTDSETANYSRIAAALIGELEPEPADIPLSGPMAADTSDWFGWYIPSPNRFATFLYLDTIFGAGKLGGGENGLVFDAIQASPRHLRATGGYLFSAENRDTTSHVLTRGEQGEYLLSDGFKNYAKVNAAFIFLLAASLIAGLSGIVWFFVAGLLSIARYRSKALRRPETPALFGIIGLLLPIPLYLTQSFMAIGDLTPASALLAMASLALPLSMVVTLLRVKAMPTLGPVLFVHCLAAISVIQWCLVLAIFGMLPVMMWR
jgi:CubicO group peptidase (beta-lactamase class C family)